MSRGERVSFNLAVSCPGCGETIQTVMPLVVTHYQPSGPVGTRRRTLVSPHRPKGQSKIIATHECKP